MKHLVVLSGAGVSAESGLATFRDHEGLWEQYPVESVATPEAWERDPELVLRFYNARRKNVLMATPNQAHLILAKLEADYKVSIITQNIDDLHERAGATSVWHLHGEILKMRSIGNADRLFDIRGDIHLGMRAPDGLQLRPHVVWFGEPVPAMEAAVSIVESADIFLVVGTSLNVYPAAGLLQFVPAAAPVYVIDKKIPPGLRGAYAIEALASEGMARLREMLRCS